MAKIIAEVGDRKISFEYFINTFFSLLVGYSIVDNTSNIKFGKSDVEKLSKVIFDLTLELVLSSNYIRELLEKEKKAKFETTKIFSDGENLKNLIIDRLTLIGDKDSSKYLDLAILQEIIDTQNFISDFIQSHLMEEGITSYEKLEEYYNTTFKGFLFLSFLFVSIPKLLKKSERVEIERKIREDDPRELEKFYERDSEKIVYYYDNIDVFNYFTSSEEFESQKMYKLYDILQGVGVDPDNMVLDENIKGEIIKTTSENRENFYKFTQIDYDKPLFNEKIYQYIKEYVFDSLYDEVWEKLYDEAMDKIRIKYYDENIKELENLVRPISRRWFESTDKIY
ncbi:MAG: hypothetical protein ABDH28_05165 [Brevinematia bacterium]